MVDKLSVGVLHKCGEKNLLTLYKEYASHTVCSIYCGAVRVLCNAISNRGLKGNRITLNDLQTSCAQISVPLLISNEPKLCQVKTRDFSKPLIILQRLYVSCPLIPAGTGCLTKPLVMVQKKMAKINCTGR